MPKGLRIKEGKDGNWYWSFVDDNGRIIATGEGYDSKSNVMRALDNIVNEFKQLPEEWRSHIPIVPNT